MNNTARTSKPPSDEEIQSLRALVPLNTLPDDVLEQLVEHVVVETVKRGQMLFNEGDTDHQHVYLVKGRVALLNNRSVVERVEAGSDTARFPLAHQVPRKYSARAEVKSRITRIDSRQLSDFLARSQTVDYQVADFDAASEDDWMSMLLQSPVLQQVPAANLQRVMMSVEQVEVEAGEDLIRQGDPGDFYYMLTSGHAVVKRDNGDGKGPVELATLGPGDAFGEEALLSDTPRNSTITMVQDGMILRLRKDDFLQLIQNPLLEQLDMKAAKAKVKQGAIWLDLRDSAQYDESHLEGAINFPFESLRYQTESLDPERLYVVYSSTPALAMAGAFLLTERGFDVSVLDASPDGTPVPPAAASAVPDTPEQAAEPVDDAATEQRIRAAEARAKELEAQLQLVKQGNEDVASDRAQDIAQIREAVDQARRKLVETEEQKREALAAQQQAYSEMEALTGNLEKLQSERSSLLERMTEIEGLDTQLQDRLAKAERELIGERERAESATHSLDELSARLNEEIERREEERDEHARERGELKEELTALQMELEQANLDLEELRETIIEQQAAADAESDNRETLRNDLQAREQEHRTLLGEHERLRGELAELQAQRDRDAARQRELEDGEQQAAKVLEDLQTQFDALGSEHDTLQQELAELHTQRDQDAARRRELEDGEQQAATALEELQARFDALGSERDNLQQELAELQAQRDRDAARQGELEEGEQQAATALQELQAQFDALGSEHETLQQEHAELQTQRERDAAGQHDLEKRERQSADELQQVREQLEALTAQRDNLSEKLQQRETESAQAAADLQAERDAAQGAGEQLTALRTEFDELRARHEALQSEMASGNEQAGTAIAQAQTRTRELEAELADQAERAEQRLADKQAELDTVSASLDERDKTLTELREANDGAAEELERLRADLESSRVRVDELEALTASQAQASTVQLDERTQELAQREAALAGLETQHQKDRDALDAVQAQLGELQRELDDSRQAQASLESRLASQSEAAEAASRRVEALDGTEQQLSEARQALESLQLELDASREQSASAAAEIAEKTTAETESKAEIERLQNEIDRLTGQLTAARDGEEASIGGLREELADLAQRLEERDLALTAARAEQAELIEALNAASAERETLQLAVSDRDDEQARLVDLENQVAEALRTHQRELLAHEQDQHRLKEQLDQAAERRRALEEEVERLTELVEQDAQTAEGDVRAERDALQAELVLRDNEVEQLRGVIEEYVDQIRDAQTGGHDPSEVAALRTELEMVREQAVRDVAQMREQLAAAETQKRRLQQADEREAVSHEAMRQKIEELESSISERQRDLSQAEDAQHMLEDELEDTNRRLDELQREVEKAQAEADEAVSIRREAENAREQLQQALQRLQQDADEVRATDLRDERLQMGKAPLGIDAVTGTGRWLSAALGAGVVFAGLEAASFLTGNGELVSLLLRLAGQ